MTRQMVWDLVAINKIRYENNDGIREEPDKVYLGPDSDNSTSLE